MTQFRFWFKALNPKHRASTPSVVTPASFFTLFRMFVVGAIVFAGVCVWAALKFYGISNQHSDDIRNNRQLLQKLQDIQTSGHADRLSEDANLQNQINQAVCTFVDGIAPGVPRIDAARDAYNCGPYDPVKATQIPTFTPSNSIPRPSPTPTSQKTTQNGEDNPTPAPISSATQSRSATLSASAKPSSSAPALLPTVCATAIVGICL